ncbi:unnamed protein product [Penicillium salamii]|uniref:HAUS augmin-like complex subunit 6 N-terminal domain-containing protein n=1 Tax=Penicillium salamii TaxID=1612424 RepID=A0A9W4NPY5_9EURO|nr:unnamed protein product [Penicillium salamii]CAG8074177.1 unnamed protein product [Penicillium salamii]CAG8119138.1 unnamed protein product [Penicillium salamii]CAG8132452.1 unnamed protein product [Penicillium salamii]CAG8298888.1 unnamed protein product [Penicillium salamii]
MATSGPVRPKPLNWQGPSHLEIFCKNLKLLQLDQLEGWPGISLRALSPSSQNQRQRIRRVEWALYQLYVLWDPEGAQNKLRPFFPPLEPLQSVNLRAALFRCLGELKKNGDLGREIVVRKTMLDDCKGEKFEELLAGFSTAVLRKLVAVSVDEKLYNTAMKLSNATTMTPTDYQNLLPLILAHQTSLSSAGERHARVRDVYDRFSQLLDDKKIDLTERAGKPPIDLSGSHSDPQRLVHEVRTNWLGSQKWATAILEGGSETSTEAFLELPFREALVRAGDLSSGKTNTGLGHDLVLDLEARVLLQRSRLHKWHEYNRSFSGQGNPNGTAADTKEPRVTFRDHQTLTVASIAKTVRQPGDRGRGLKGADKYLLSSVHETLARVNGKSCGNPTRSTPAARTVTQRPLRRSPDRVYSPSMVAEDSPPPEIQNPTPGSRSPSQPSQIEPEPEPEPEPNPGPENEPESDTLQSSTPIVRLSPDLSSASASDDEPRQEPVKSSKTLAERTRRSMSLLPPQHHEPPRQRRGPRPSFPVNQFVTPRKTSDRSVKEISRASTPQDQLFEEDAEYASVFKSRPRVALSPISSPAVHVSPSYEDEGFALDEGDSAEWDVSDSPSAAPRFR